MTLELPDFVALLAAFVRTSALLATAPFLDTLNVGMRLKGALALAISLLLVPSVGPLSCSGAVGLVVLVLGETAMGAAIGLAARLLVAAMELAGAIVGYQTGFWLPRTMDPGSAVAPELVSALWGVLAGLTFLALDGPELLITALAASFQLRPQPDAAMGAEMLRLSARIFPLALAVAAPLLVTLWLTDTALAVAQRSVPRLDVLFVSYPLKTALTLAALAVSAHLTVAMFSRLMGGLEGDLTGLLARP